MLHILREARLSSNSSCDSNSIFDIPQSETVHTNVPGPDQGLNRCKHGTSLVVVLASFAWPVSTVSIETPSPADVADLIQDVSSWWSGMITTSGKAAAGKNMCTLESATGEGVNKGMSFYRRGLWKASDGNQVSLCDYDMTFDACHSAELSVSLFAALRCAPSRTLILHNAFKVITWQIRLPDQAPPQYCRLNIWRPSKL